MFECLVYAHVNEGKFEPRPKKCIFFCYQDGIRKYRLWEPKESKFMISRDVTFDDVTILNLRTHTDHDVANKKVEL